MYLLKIEYLETRGDAQDAVFASMSLEDGDNDGQLLEL